MFSRRATRGWQQMLVNQGLVSTLSVAFGRVRTRFRRTVPEIPQQSESWQLSSIHPFDTRYGVDTSGLIWGEHLAGGNKNDSWNTAYYGIAPSVFHTLMVRLRIDFPQFAFVDMGSGKGRGVLLAVQYPFKEVIGVELAEPLHRIAQKNVKTYAEQELQCRSIMLLHMDAAEFTFPAEPLVLFFYHPFCKPVLKQVLRNLQVSLRQYPRAVYLVYINPELKPVLDGIPFLEKVLEETLPMDAEDRLADRVGSSVEECVVYRARV